MHFLDQRGVLNRQVIVLCNLILILTKHKLIKINRMFEILFIKVVDNKRTKRTSSLEFNNILQFIELKLFVTLCLIIRFARPCKIRFFIFVLTFYSIIQFQHYCENFWNLFTKQCFAQKSSSVKNKCLFK